MAQLTDEEKKERQKVRREKRASLFYDLCKLTFAGVVIGGITPIFSKSIAEVNWPMIIVGALSSLMLAVVADRILK